MDNMFGNDWEFNYMQGLFNRAFPPGHFAGYDLSQLYGEAHLPVLTPGGLDVKGGLWYTLAGYEQVPAIARPLLSVPYMFNYGQPFRHVGVVTTLHLTPRINLYNGTINGWDRWIDERYLWGYIGGFSWVSRDEKTNIAFTCVWGPDQFPRFLPANQPLYPTGYVNIPSLAGRANPGYAGNDRTLFTTVLTHKWGSKLTQIIETDQGWELNVPGLASNGANGAPRTAELVQLRQLVPLRVQPQADRRLAQRDLLGPHRRPHRLRRHLSRDDTGADLQAQGLHLDPPRGPLRLGAVRHPLQQRHPRQPVHPRIRRHLPLLDKFSREGERIEESPDRAGSYSGRIPAS